MQCRLVLVHRSQLIANWDLLLFWQHTNVTVCVFTGSHEVNLPSVLMLSALQILLTLMEDLANLSRSDLCTARIN